ncbi:nuclear transport factor 2 family protein [Dyadobacter sp. CY312]|uniref:nuclear transport factor 2 family protein n=1 Tax=Dyadobacter sp. CY312 TaxID=2907303 RepID=UPI001F2815DC|nr:nuclear transport factor 2 family protein [Dyadobacter sp. CY312]MCE7038874.1 nuclear transport factor 2 family protein [Dyadobacter sp. CY312]
MTTNEQLIHQFYSAFQNKDFATMQACYADDATFTDAAFVDLNADQVRAMWEMLCKNGKDLKLTFGKIQSHQDIVNAEWTAVYLFSKTGKMVTNNVMAEFVIKNGLIVSHRDKFDFYTWAKQAFGFTGLLIGWTSFFQNKVQTTAKASLEKFMNRNA